MSACLWWSNSASSAARCRRGTPAPCRKEDCADLRNSKVADLTDELETYGVRVSVHDPAADRAEALREYGIELSDWAALPRAHAIVAAVAHRAYRTLDAVQLCDKLVDGGTFIDVKAAFAPDALRQRGVRVWRL
jgi:UDP-N-acetyl-D-galactosamine dehydrogenase